MSTTKTPITVRMDPTLLAQVRLGAARENRSVTNFIETALRAILSGSTDSGARVTTSRARTTEKHVK